jgi:fucose permease
MRVHLSAYASHHFILPLGKTCIVIVRSHTHVDVGQGFSYGLIDTLNKHFQNTLGITRSRSSGLQAAYFGAYPLASLGHANWILRHWGYKACFIWGLSLYGVGALLAWPCLVYRSFGGFCAATFVIGNGLGSLETAANPYLAVCKLPGLPAYFVRSALWYDKCES